MRSPSIHVASLWQGEKIYRSELGTLTRLTADNFPILSGLSIKRLTLAPGAFREPHWHANATELTYCTAGRALVSVLDDGCRFSSFLVSAGEMFHIDSGALHHVENIGDTDAEFVLAFRHERPEDFGERLFPQGRGGHLRHCLGRPPGAAVHPCRPPDRDAEQSARPLAGLSPDRPHDLLGGAARCRPPCHAGTGGVVPGAARTALRRSAGQPVGAYAPTVVPVGSPMRTGCSPGHIRRPE